MRDSAADNRRVWLHGFGDICAGCSAAFDTDTKDSVVRESALRLINFLILLFIIAVLGWLAVNVK